MNVLKQWFQSLSRGVRAAILTACCVIVIALFFIVFVLLCKFAPIIAFIIFIIMISTLLWMVIYDSMD